MRPFLIFIFSILSFSLFAQAETDSAAVVTDSLDVSVNETSVAVNDSIAAANDKFDFRIIIDYGKLLTLPMGFEKKYQIGIAAKINQKIGIGGEYGMAELTPNKPYNNAESLIKGTYYGAYIQYHVNIDFNNMLYGGIGFSKGDFEEELTYVISSEIWGDFIKKEHRKGLSSSWTTVRLGSEQKLSRFFTIGGTFMLRILNNTTSVEGIQPYAIPGFGIAGPNIVPAFNAYLCITLL